MTKTLGFHNRGRKPTELEESMGSLFVDVDREPFSHNKEKTVAVHVGNHDVYGVYKGLNDKGFIVLFPSVKSEFTPLNTVNLEQGRRICYWENERPDFVRFDAITGMSPIRAEYLERIVSGDTLEKQWQMEGLHDYSI